MINSLNRVYQVLRCRVSLWKVGWAGRDEEVLTENVAVAQQMARADADGRWQMARGGEMVSGGEPGCSV